MIPLHLFPRFAEARGGRFPYLDVVTGLNLGSWKWAEATSTYIYLWSHVIDFHEKPEIADSYQPEASNAKIIWELRTQIVCMDFSKAVKKSPGYEESICQVTG